MKKGVKKLSLNKETLRLLSDKSVSNIGGGFSAAREETEICGMTQLPCTWTCGGGNC
jgi:hypothetical protein